MRVEQEHKCALCGAEGHLSIHHKEPASKGGANTRANAVGLCRTPCHDLVDELTIERGIPWETILEEGVETLIGHAPQRAQDAISDGSGSEPAPYYPQIQNPPIPSIENAGVFREEGFYPLWEPLKQLFPEIE